MIQSKFNLQKLFKIILQVLFYSVICIVFVYVFGEVKIGKQDVLMSLLPTIYSMYWFATTYIILYILSPFLNIFIKALNKEMHIKLIGILVFIWCIIPTIFTVNPGFSYLGWFITLYLIAGYIRLYPNKFFEDFKTNMIISIVMYGLALLSVIFLGVAGLKIGSLTYNDLYFMQGNRILIFVCSITLFLAFKNMKMKSIKMINVISSATFGVYLIHDNYYMRPYLWKTLFNCTSYASSKYLIIQAVVTITSVYIVCTVIELIRSRYIERYFFKLIDKFKENLIKKKIN